MKASVPVIRVCGLARISAFLDRSRLAREQCTMDVMIRIFCRSRHGIRDGLCTDCAGLRDYAAIRLQRCQFGQTKPTCANCPVHCYQPHRREQMKLVMRFAGPRMLWRHPILAGLHLLDGYRQPASS